MLKNKKLHMASGGFTALTALVLRITTFQKVLDSTSTLKIIGMYLGIYVGTFLICAAIQHKGYKTRKIDSKESQQNFVKQEADKPLAEPVVYNRDMEIENNLLYMQSQERDMLDRLTGLLSYNSFYKKLNVIEERSLEANEKFFLLIIDIDRFKLINQQYGYTVGDKILGEIGNVIQNCIRDRGIAGRHGGEEFVVALPNIDYKKAAIIADALRMQIKAVPEQMEELKHQDIELSVSIGMACYPEASNDIHSLVSIAEIKMRKGKGLGGDRVTA